MSEYNLIVFFLDNRDKSQWITSGSIGNEVEAKCTAGVMAGRLEFPLFLKSATEVSILDKDQVNIVALNASLFWLIGTIMSSMRLWLGLLLTGEFLGLLTEGPAEGRVRRSPQAIS